MKIELNLTESLNREQLAIVGKATREEVIAFLNNALLTAVEGLKPNELKEILKK